MLEDNPASAIKEHFCICKHSTLTCNWARYRIGSHREQHNSIIMHVHVIKTDDAIHMCIQSLHGLRLVNSPGKSITALLP